MFLRILKKDIRRKKSMNIILLLFVIICSMFLSSSVNNLQMITSALDYFYTTSNANDYYIMLHEYGNMEANLDNNELVEGYERHDYIGISTMDISHKDGILDANSSISITTLTSQYDFVFDQNDKKIQLIEDGEIALANTVCERNGLVVGDTIEIKFGDTVILFKLAYNMKDIVFGSDFMSINQAIVSKSDFEKLKTEPMADIASQYMYSIKTSSPDTLRNENRDKISRIFLEIFESDVKNTYIMDMMIFAIFIIVSICLILIAFALLRFTINTTIQEDYKEIGIMRAIGLPDKAVISLYLVKYLTISIIGSVIGVFIGIPFGELMLRSLRKNIVMNPGSDFPVIQILCALFIVLILYLFCRYSTGKIVRLSAVQAIRSGSSGKRYSRNGKLRLKRFKRANTVWFMSLNDIVCNRKNYIVLFLTFIIGAILFIFPSNAASTLNSDEMIRHMGISKPDVFINDNHQDTILIESNYDSVISQIHELEQTYENAGISIDLYRTYMFSSSVYTNDPKQSTAIYVTQATEDSHNNLALLKGSYPALANEIVMTEKSMEKLGIEIGDRVNIVIGADDREYIIVGSYESMMNMGQGISLSSLADADFSQVAGVFDLGGVFLEQGDFESNVEILRKATPDYEIRFPREYTKNILSGVPETIMSLKNQLGVILLIIFCLISILMSRTFYTKDLGDIALLKSIGFSNKTLHFWQVFRISIAMLTATIVGFILSVPLTPLLNRFTFGIMGAPNIPTVVDYMEAYIMYPLIMLFGVSISIYISTMTIRRITMRDIGAIE